MKKIMIINHYNLNNGDRAVLEGTLQILKDFGIREVNLSVVDKESFKTNIKGINTNLVPWGVKFNSIVRRKLFSKVVSKLKVSNIKKYSKVIYNQKYLENIDSSDIILVSGGHHLTDIVGDEAFYRLAFDMIYPITLGKKVILLPQTIGPFKHSDSHKIEILRFILENVECVAIRDQNSLDFIDSMNIKTKKISILPDMVYGLYNVLKQEKKEKQKKSIGIALYGNYPGKEGQDKIKKYLTELSGAIDILNKELTINFIPMEVKNSTSDDRKLIEFIKNSVKDNSNINILEENCGILETIKNFSQNEIIIAYKTHSVLFSLLQSIPIIAVAYHKKSIDFMDMYKLSEYSIWDKDVTSNKLVDLVRKIQNNNQEIIKIENSITTIKYKELYNFISNII